MALSRDHKPTGESPFLSVEEKIERARWFEARNLSLRDNELTALPDSIGQLTQLEDLHLSCPQLTSLPDSIGSLTRLRRIYSYESPLEMIPESIGELKQLQEFVVLKNSLSKLPESIGELLKLNVLALSGGRLRDIPENIRKLTQLITFHLVDVRLLDIPDCISSLRKLRNCNLANNEIKYLPESLKELGHLQVLDLSNNQLVQLPQWLSELPQLSLLFLHGNPLLRLPDEILGLNNFGELQNPLLKTGKNLPEARPDGILAYYFKAQAEMRPLNEAKLILVGRGNAGKTSLVNRLVHKTFQPEQKTEGIKITEWDFSLFDKEDVRLNVWDFGGQEIMHATHQFFLTQRSLYLLVINGREGGEDADADYWLKLIENFGGESPVIVVLNKIKEHPFSLNEPGLRSKFPNIREIIRTDCSDGTGVDEVRRAIERETDRLPHLRDAFPANWFAIKDNLGGMKKNYLSFASYQRKCRELGERDPYWQKQLATYLHRLGIALNFSDDPRLNDTHVLNPHWVTNGIYKVLNSSLLEEQKGEISLADLPKILSLKDYPTTMHRFLIDLMKKFDLCFSYTDDECHYLIPELLEKQEPPQVQQFDALECLNFQYHYPVALEGLLPRFIVLSHTQIEGDLRWRTGAILKFEGCRALVRADTQDRKVFISVKGPLKNRNRLLAVIRSQFETIHGSFNNLEVQEMVPIPNFPNETVAYKHLRVYEEKGFTEFSQIINDEPVMLSVQELLNGVDLEGTRRKENFMDKHTEPIRLFISYSHKDESFREELETHLSIMRRQGVIDAWQDRKIGAGSDFGKDIAENLAKADIVLLLISADFINSDYCYDKEMTRAMERYEKGEATVIPIVLRDCDWHGAPFGKLNALPKDGKAVTLWADKDSAWRNVSEGIKKTVEELRKKKSATG